MSEQLTPGEEAVADAIEADFAAFFARWKTRGFPPNIVVPMAFITAVDAAKRNGISFESAIETLRLVWHGKPS